ncbi:MAG: saccharopine dehydrogenase NADP-binding domain-containing protein, partial [Bacteroidia bacterium]|nr:saccharopine dehydrogenase NADP-binding domain-containing protein [Bacteroidia bacterium]
MNNILIIGAGMCSGALIQYVLQEADIHGWFVTVADIDLNKAQRHVSNNTRARAAWLDVLKSNDRRDLIHRSDLVVTMLPAHLHLEVAHDCIRLNKLLVTAASVTQELYRLGDEGRERSLSFTGEMSLDPGLEHMAAKRNIDDIEGRGGT